MANALTKAAGTPEKRNALLEFLQAASNAAAQNVSGPVDLIGAGLRYLGVPVPEDALGSSQWMAQRGLTAEVPMGAPRILGETAGMAGPIAAAAYAPQIAAWRNMVNARLAPGAPGKMPTSIPRGAVTLAPNDANRLVRMAEQGYTPGYWRGGKSVADGSHYTPDASAAADFGRRVAGDAADVREYAIRLGNSLDFSKRYTPEQLIPLRDVLARDYQSKYADELLSVPGDYQGGAPGAAIYQILHTLTGGDAAGALRKAGFDTINAGQEVVTLHKAGLVRDAKRALFDPKRMFDADPFAAIGSGAVGLGLLNQAADNE